MRSGKRPAPENCYWRGNTLWGRFEVNGREERFSLGTDRPALAQERLKAKKERLTAIWKFGDGRRTWAEAVAAWEPQARATLGPKTITRYLTSLAQVSEHLTDETFLDEINQTLIWEIVEDRRDEGVAGATIRRDLSAIAAVCKFVTALRWPGASNPARDIIGLVKERRDPIVLPEPSDIEQVAACAAEPFASLIRAAWRTGCRQSELAGAQWPRIDLEARQMTVIGKGNKMRTIALFDAYGVFSRLTRHNRAPWAFWHDDGEPFRAVAGQFRRYVAAAAARAALAQRPFRPFRFHDLRHRFAVDFLKEGRGTIYDLQLHLGHTSVMTTEVYLKYLTPAETLAAKHGIGTKSGTEQRFEVA